ncbi:phosphate signaling complex protein PhoU [Methanococcus aeolicus]|uniref:Phosphate-specific transport system accessory protein PhoU n=1 Tax=Methanococcus aeolicus (strain ATCC BAA-1280 / DSM 17508 / OCM 812 / Nankai-3) TaxID=419665 RepID=A6UUI6_META3|nr:phosphate signaling complex protein PhoU [Methanococcus aeolicus]ABR56158.1 phosphate uptake regulator, PhoU [Methanococcus aeolicus Nankai-3]UXM84162.1 phosphate signaling complex protein PhoU [Methanococcus aeolicus]
MVRNAYDTQIEEIEQDVIKMGELCIESLEKSVQAFLKSDKELAKKIREGDNVIDLMEMEIEEKCVSIMALQQPVASDLRRLLTVLKIISKLEKIGDNASKISKITLRSNTKMNKDSEILNVMVLYLKDMLKDILKAYQEKNEELAREVYKRDKKIDKLFEELYGEMIRHIIENPSHTSKVTEIIFVGKYLERNGNLIASIGDRIVYMITGERIKEEEFDYKHFE